MPAMRFRQHQVQAKAATRRLLLLFLLTVALTVIAANAILAAFWSLQTGNLVGYPRWFFETNSVLCAGFILGGSWLETLQLRGGGAHVAERVGAREMLVPSDGYQRRLRNVVEEMAIATGLKAPRIFLLERDDAINAFAAGWEQNDSVIAVTRGALQRLDRDELQGVVAHEFSHILNGDARLNMRLIGYVWGLQLLFLLGRDMFDATDARGRRTVLVLMGLGLMAVGSLGWLAGRLLKAAVSRQREFLADAAAVQFTRQSDGIGRALRKIAGQVRDGQASVRSARAEVISHMLLSSDIFAGAGALATHPPLAERIRRIYGHTVAPLRANVVDVPASASPQSPDIGLAMAFDAGDLQGAAPGATDAPDALTHTVGMRNEAISPSQSQQQPQPQQVAWLDDMLAIAWPHDLVAATLAFLVPSDTDSAYAVWLSLCARPDATSPEFVLRQAWSLPANMRQDGFERLLTRCASLPPADRSKLRHQAHQIVRADGRLDAAELWHCLLLDHVLAPRRISIVREADYLSLETCAAAIAGVTDILAAQRYRGHADAAPIRAAWRVALCADLGLPACTDAPALVSWSAVVHAVGQLARLSWMLRPRLMKAWCVLVLDDRSPMPLVVADALRTLCILIDTPMPPALQARYPQHSELQPVS